MSTDILECRILGHESQEKLFLDLFKKDALPHALVFTGAEGIGKTTMGFRLAKFLFKYGGAQDEGLFGDALPQEFSSLDIPGGDPIASRVASGGHADLLHIAREYNASTNKMDTTLKVDALRRIEPFLRKTSSEGGWRIVIVEDADTMNRNAQNAILKILEEPPARVLIILIAHSAGALIPTIRSRTRVVHFNALCPENMRILLEQQGHNLNAQDAEILSALSAGSIGRATRLIEDEGLEMLCRILELLGANGKDVHDFASTLGQASQDKQYRVFVDLFQWVFRSMLFLKSRGEAALPIYLKNNYLESLFKSYSLQNLITISDDLKNHFEQVEFSNLDRRDAVRSVFLLLERV